MIYCESTYSQSSDVNFLDVMGQDLHISVREFITAGSVGSHSCGCQGATEQLDVGLLVDRDVLEVVIVGGGVPSIHEVLLGEVVDGSMIEGVLKVFELRACQLLVVPRIGLGSFTNRQGELEDCGVNVG